MHKESSKKHRIRDELVIERMEISSVFEQLNPRSVSEQNVKHRQTERHF